MSPILPNSIEDLRAVARSRIPRALFDYIDRGSYDELTWHRNRDDLRALRLRQRVMVDVSRVSTGTPPGVGMGIKPDPIFLNPGDVMELGIEKLGSQRQTVAAA